jgi:hypothetical protein
MGIAATSAAVAAIVVIGAFVIAILGYSPKEKPAHEIEFMANSSPSEGKPRNRISLSINPE